MLSRNIPEGAMSPYLSLKTREKIQCCKLMRVGSLVPRLSCRIRAWVPRGFHARLPSDTAPDRFHAQKGASAAPTSRSHTRSHDTEHGCCFIPPYNSHRCIAYGITAVAAAAGGASGSDVWKWQEPVLDGSLSTSDRAVLALARATANLSDKLAVEQAAVAQGLSLVTNSDVCVGPLLPPFGFTMEEDGEEGDGMALPPPSCDAPRRELRDTRVSGTLAGTAASALLGAVFSGGAADIKGTGAPHRTAAGAAAGSAPSLGALRSSTSAGGTGERPVPPVRRTTNPDARLRNLALVVAEGGGGDDDEGEDEEVLQAFADDDDGGVRGGDGELAASASGFMGAAAAALTRVARAAVASAVDVPAPVGRAAVGAATVAVHAAQAAVATAAKATAHIMMPNYGDPSSSWLVADDPVSGVRYIVIAAGPELRRRTPHELTMDLVTFETYNLGIKVNKRLYAEATALYARFMPLVMDFLEAVPDGSICFGGQGVGGSLAIMLQLMCCHRGLRFARLLPAVAVDSPAVLGQVPLEHRRMWGATSREQQQHLSQDSVEDMLEDLMHRTVLEELGLPHDAVRNLVLPPPPQAPPTQPSRSQSFFASSPLPVSTSALSIPRVSTWQGTGQQQQQVQSPAAPILVLTTAGGAAAAVAGGNSGGTVTGPVQPQIFRVIGKVVHVETIGSLNARVSSAVATAAAVVPVPAREPAVHPNVEMDGGNGEITTAAAVTAGCMSSRFSDKKRLDAAMMGSIATAAATAAASAAVAQLRHVGAGAFRAVTANQQRRGASVAARAELGAAASGTLGMLPAVLKEPPGHTEPLDFVAEEGSREQDEDPSAWGV